MNLHPTSVVEDGAVIGAGVEIGPFCHVGPRAILEDGVRLRSHVSVTGVTRIGARSDLYPGVAVGGAVCRTAAAARLGGKPGRMFAVLVIDGRAIGHLDIF